MPIRYPTAAFFFLLAPPALAQDSAAPAQQSSTQQSSAQQSLAQQAKNPFADLVNLQFIYDATLRVGPAGDTEQVITIQPLIPFNLNPDWLVITRTILPLISQPGLAAGQGTADGAGDTQFSTFLSPAHPGSWVWGLGPVLQIPSATNSALGQGKWGAGPTAGVQWTGTQWTFGALINNIWSFAGSANRAAVNQMQLEPEINYTFRSNPNRYLSFMPTISANWTAAGAERWTVPVSLGMGQLVKFGAQSVNFQATTYYNVVTPADSPHWTLELLVQFLFPH
jgi:hypothetical protein